MTEFLTFTSALPDDAEWNGEFLQRPAGWEHCRLIRSHLAGWFRLRREPWNEEDYAWEFQVEANQTTISVLLGEADDAWLVQIFPVAFLGFLRRKRTLAAVKLVTDAVESFLKGDPQFGDVRRRADYSRTVARTSS